MKHLLLILFFALGCTIITEAQVSMVAYRPDSLVQMNPDSAAAQLNASRAVFNEHIPKKVNRMNDFTHLFSEEQGKCLTLLFTYFEQQTKIPIALVTLDSTMTDKAQFETLTATLLDHLCEGDKDKNDGMLICISIDYRLIQIQNSARVEKALPNSEIKKIIDAAFIPYFKKNSYFEGTLNGLKILQKKMKSRNLAASDNADLTLQ